MYVSMLDVANSFLGMMTKRYGCVEKKCKDAMEYILRRHMGVYHESYLNTSFNAHYRLTSQSKHYAWLNQERYIDGSVETNTRTLAGCIEKICDDVDEYNECKTRLRRNGRCPMCEKIVGLSYNGMEKHQSCYTGCIFRTLDKEQNCNCKCKDCGSYLSMCKCAIRCGNMYQIEEKRTIYCNLQGVLSYFKGDLEVAKTIMGYVDAFARPSYSSYHDGKKKTLYRLKCKSCRVLVPVLNPWLTCPRLCNPMVWIGAKNNNVQWECPFCAVMESNMTTSNREEMAAFVLNKIERAKDCFPNEDERPCHTYVGGVNVMKLMDAYFCTNNISPRSFQRRLNRKMYYMKKEEYSFGLTTILDHGKNEKDTFNWLHEKLWLSKKNSSDEPDFYGHPLYTQEPWFSFMNRMSDTEFKQTYWNCITFAEYGPNHEVITELCKLPVQKLTDNDSNGWLIGKLHKVTFAIARDKNTERFKDFIAILDEAVHHREYRRTYGRYLETPPHVQDYDYDMEYGLVYASNMEHNVYQYGLQHEFHKNWHCAEFYSKAIRAYNRDPQNKEDYLITLDQFCKGVRDTCELYSLRCNYKEFEAFVNDTVYFDREHQRHAGEPRWMEDEQEYECRLYHGNDFRDYDAHNMNCPVQYMNF